MNTDRVVQALNTSELSINTTRIAQALVDLNFKEMKECFTGPTPEKSHLMRYLSSDSVVVRLCNDFFVKIQDAYYHSTCVFKGFHDIPDSSSTNSNEDKACMAYIDDGSLVIDGTSYGYCVLRPELFPYKVQCMGYLKELVNGTQSTFYIYGEKLRDHMVRYGMDYITQHGNSTGVVCKLKQEDCLDNQDDTSMLPMISDSNDDALSIQGWPSWMLLALATGGGIMAVLLINFIRYVIIPKCSRTHEIVEIDCENDIEASTDLLNKIPHSLNDDHTENTLETAEAGVALGGDSAVVV